MLPHEVATVVFELGHLIGVVGNDSTDDRPEEERCEGKSDSAEPSLSAPTAFGSRLFARLERG